MPLDPDPWRGRRGGLALGIPESVHSIKKEETKDGWSRCHGNYLVLDSEHRDTYACLV
jgi:hypothetical protein